MVKVNKVKFVRLDPGDLTMLAYKVMLACEASEASYMRVALCISLLRSIAEELVLIFVSSSGPDTLVKYNISSKSRSKASGPVHL